MAGNGTTVIAVIAAADRPTASNVNTLYAIISALLPTAALVVGLRFYSRRSITKTLGADDWICLVSLVGLPKLQASRESVLTDGAFLLQALVIAMCTTMILMTKAGLGAHLDTVPAEKLVRYFKVRVPWFDISFREPGSNRTDNRAG